MIKLRSCRYSYILCILTGLLTACSGDNSDLQRYIREVKSRPGRTIEPIPKFAPLPIFKFPESEARRSPFKPVEKAKGNDKFAPDVKRAKQPLEAFPLDALKFVGILKQDNETWALIKEPSKQIARVRVGNYMGLNYGKIISIKNDVIKLEESVRNSGAWEKKITTLNLEAGK